MFKRMVIALLLVAGCAVPSNPAVPSSRARATDLRELVEAHVANGFSGVVLVGKGDRHLIFDGFGALEGRPVAARDAFWIASAGKQFASAGILKLVDDGRLRLDDPLVRFFPDSPADKAAITVRQLLSHTSGLGQSYVSENQTDRGVAVARMLAEPLVAPPGSSFRYSNSNIQLAAAIIEIVSGMTYADYARTQLWTPVGLASTGLAGSPAAAAVSSIRGELPPRLQSASWGEQGVFSTAGDLFLWYRALRAGRILRPHSVHTLFEPVARTGEGQAALGWFTGISPAGRALIFTRGNEDFGANSLIYAYPDRDIVIIILTHAGNARDGTSWSRKIHAELEAALQL